MPDVFKQTLDSILPKVTGDNADEVKTALRKLGVLYEDTASSLKTFGEENKSKRLEIDGLNTQIRDLTHERDGLKTKVSDLEDSDDLKELQTLREQVKTINDKRRTDFIAQYDQVSQLETFKKVESKFQLPKDDKGKIKWDDVDDDQINHCSDRLSEYQELGVLGKTQKPPETFGDSPPPNPPASNQNQPPAIPTDTDVRNAIKAAFQ